MDVASDEDETAASPIDVGLAEFAKKIAIFEPEEDADAASSESKPRPLKFNLDFALYKAKVLTRNYRYAEAQLLLEKCIYYWPEDGRAYVALGKTLSKQSKGCQATQGLGSFRREKW